MSEPRVITHCYMDRRRLYEFIGVKNILLRALEVEILNVYVFTHKHVEFTKFCTFNDLYFCSIIHIPSIHCPRATCSIDKCNIFWCSPPHRSYAGFPA